MNSERSQELRSLLNDRKLQILYINDPTLKNSDVSQVSLFLLMDKYIPKDERDFNLQDLELICNFEESIIELMYIRRMLDEELQYLDYRISDNEYRIDELREWVDHELQILEEEYDEMRGEMIDGRKEDEEKIEWDTRREEIIKNLKLKKNEMTERREELIKERRRLQEETRFLNVLLEEIDRKEIRFEKTLTEVLGILDYWLTYKY